MVDAHGSPCLHLWAGYKLLWEFDGAHKHLTFKKYHQLSHVSHSSHSNSSTQSTAVDSRLVWHRRQLRACYRRNVTVVRAASHARGTELGRTCVCCGLHSWKCTGVEKRRAEGAPCSKFVQTDITDWLDSTAGVNKFLVLLKVVLCRHERWRCDGAFTKLFSARRCKPCTSWITIKNTYT